MSSTPLRILTVANVPPDPNSGAAGTVFHTNVALRELGHVVEEIWDKDLGPRRIQHGNLHSWIEQPKLYRDVVLKAVASKEYDVIQMSQPQAWLAAKELKQRGFGGVVVNRSHGLELRVESVMPEWHRRLGVPESRFPRSLLTPVMKWLLSGQWPNAVKYHDAIVVPCEMDRDFLVSSIPEAANKTYMIHHGVGAEFVDVPPRALDESRLRKILYVGQFSFIKGFHILAEVLNRTLAAQDDVSCTWITAEAGHAAIRELLSEQVRTRVQLSGWRPHEELRSLYDEHGVFVFPSFFEGAGKASLEALARHMYVVASDTGAMRDYIAPTQAGSLCEVGNVGDFVQSLELAWSNPAEAMRRAEAGRAVAVEKSWQRCAENLTAMYRTVLDQKAKHRKVS
ncbi:MAG: glycosyltransferase family 4 protein [Planctomycetaceae bacterium]|nr:glycosyltransferase family 4 protein [Planctomycetaceae bacterium]